MFITDHPPQTQMSNLTRLFIFPLSWKIKQYLDGAATCDQNTSLSEYLSAKK